MQRRRSSGSVPLPIICTRHYGVCVVKTDHSSRQVTISIVHIKLS